MRSRIVHRTDVKDAALNWLEGLGWQVPPGPDIEPDKPRAER